MISIAKPDEDAAQTHGQVKDQDAVMIADERRLSLRRKRINIRGMNSLSVHTKIYAYPDASISTRLGICTSVRES